MREPHNDNNPEPLVCRPIAFFGLTADDLGDMAREAFEDHRDMDGVDWRSVGRELLDTLADHLATLAGRPPLARASPSTQEKTP